MIRSRFIGLLAVAGLLLLTVFFFWKILLTNLILVGVDTFLYFYPYKAYAAGAVREGRMPLWNPHLFMGAPLLANSQVGLFYPLNWPLMWLDAPRQIAWSIGLHIALAGSLMLALARLALRLSWLGALTAAILFAFGGYLGAQVEHINQLNAAAWLPLLFLFYHRGLHHPRRWLWFLLLGLVIALTLLAGHAQTVFISLFGLGLYGLWAGIARSGIRSRGLRAIRPVTFSLARSLGPLAVAGFLAMALAAVQLLPTAELSALSIRSGGLSYREVVSFSLRPTDLHYSLLPPLGLDLRVVLGEAFSEWVAYLGMSGLALALLGGLASLRRPQARPFVLLAGAGLLLSLGLYSGPLYLGLYYLAPGFDLFRAPARWLLLYSFAMSGLAGYGMGVLAEPACLRRRLTSTVSWLRARHWRWAVLAGLPTLFLLALIINQTPPLFTLLAWLVLLLAVGGLVWGILRWGAPAAKTPATPDGFHPLALIFLLLLVAELFWAARGLNYNRPTAPQAYSSLRNANSFLLAVDPPYQAGGPPGRFLSLSGITYDPGDLRDLEQIYGDQLSEQALYDLIVATKAKEVLYYNLPLLYGLYSVDGYDGGILPLARFVQLERLFLPVDELSLDGRLREKLRFVPPARLLSLLNARWIITDKVFDVWIDDIFYDLQFPARLEAGHTVTTSHVPDFPATAVGLVSHLEGATRLPAGAPVAKLSLTFAGGGRQAITLSAGRDTAEGDYRTGAAHPQARVGVAWPYEAAGVDYVTVYTLTHRAPLIRITVEGLLPTGRFVLRGLSLIHQPTTTSRSVLLSTEGDYRQVHSGDVKIYENREVLPRAFVVHRAEVAPTDEAVIAVMKQPGFDPGAALVRLPVGDEQPGPVILGQPSVNDRVTITSYKPERVEIQVSLGSPGWLVLTDTYYPGWQASLNDQPVDILPVDILFRAVQVPAGEHVLLFEFKPRSVYLGGGMSGLALLALLIGLGVILRK